MTGRKFWQILKKFDWDNASDDDEVMQPALDYLASLEDEEIFAFEELVAEHLYALDTRELAEKLYAEDEYISDDMFLYQRCVALINGQSYYNGIKFSPVPILNSRRYCIFQAARGRKSITPIPTIILILPRQAMRRAATRRSGKND